MEQEFVGTPAVIKWSLATLQREARDSQHVRGPRLVQEVARGHGRGVVKGEEDWGFSDPSVLTSQAFVPSVGTRGS